MIIFNNFLNSDFLYKCNILLNKIIRKNKIVLNETVYLAILVYIFTKFIYNYDSTYGIYRFTIPFLIIVIIYLFKIYAKFNIYKNNKDNN